MGNKEFRIVPEIAVQSDAVDRKQAFAAEIRSSQPPTPPTIVEPKEVGHNIYILAHQLARHNDELSSLLNPDNGKNEATRTALKYYREHTAQIEVPLFVNCLLDAFCRLCVKTERWRGSCSLSTTSATT